MLLLPLKILVDYHYAYFNVLFFLLLLDITLKIVILLDRNRTLLSSQPMYAYHRNKWDCYAAFHIIRWVLHYKFTWYDYEKIPFLSNIVDTTITQHMLRWKDLLYYLLALEWKIYGFIIMEYIFRENVFFFSSIVDVRIITLYIAFEYD